jgi:hypothetical protein
MYLYFDSVNGMYIPAFMYVAALADNSVNVPVAIVVEDCVIVMLIGMDAPVGKLTLTYGMHK